MSKNLINKKQFAVMMFKQKVMFPVENIPVLQACVHSHEINREGKH